MDLTDLVPPPSPEDILAQVARIEMGGQEFVLPVLPIAERVRWEGNLDASLSAALSTIEGVPDVSGILAVFDGQEQALVESLAAYDRDGLLGGAEAITARARTLDLIFANIRLWRAGHPLVDIGAVLLQLVMGGTEFGPTSSPPPRGTDSRPISTPPSATNSSSRSSTPRPIGSPAIGRTGSKRSGRRPSSPRTTGSTNGGAAHAGRRGARP